MWMSLCNSSTTKTAEAWDLTEKYLRKTAVSFSLDLYLLGFLNQKNLNLKITSLIRWMQLSARTVISE